MPDDYHANSLSGSEGAQDIQSPSQEFDDFIYLVSHDFRSSIRALIELPQWIAEDLAAAGVRVDGSVGESIDLMNRHTGRLDRMLVDLLTFSRVGRMQIERSVNLASALDDVLDEITVPPGFEVVQAFDCQTITIGERDVLTLLNALLSNAFKHHDRKHGKITVASWLDGDEVVLAVTDDGPGLPPQFRERVFGAMTTLRPRDEVEGSGMGLAVTRKIASVYNGTASIADSTDERGTTVVVRLPKKEIG